MATLGTNGRLLYTPPNLEAISQSDARLLSKIERLLVAAAIGS